MKEKNLGILTSISWNSQKWADDPSKNDVKKSKYKQVISSEYMHESLNFGYEKYPKEPDDTFIAYSPMLNRKPALDNSKFVKIIFFMSFNPINNKKYIVGFYGFPTFGEKYFRTRNCEKYNEYPKGNIKSHIDNIVYLENYLQVDKEFKCPTFLPIGKLVSQRGFNYLNIENVQNILAKIYQLNIENQKLKCFINKFLPEMESNEKDFSLLSKTEDTQSNAELLKIAKSTTLTETQKQAIIQSRRGQGIFRNELIKIWNGCAITQYKDTAILIASHIKPWKDATNDERLDPYNGLLLLPNFDKVFDKGLITFDSNGKIIISKQLQNYSLLGLSIDIVINIQEKHIPYLLFHNENIFKK